MNTNATTLLAQLAQELPALARQAASSDVSARTACVMRLSELATLLAPYRAAHRPTPTRSRRSVLRAGVFAGWALKGEE